MNNKLFNLKASIENNAVTDDCIIFLVHDCDFIPTQYYRKIAQLKNLRVNVVDQLSEKTLFNIFNDENELTIYRVDNLKNKFNNKNTIIIANKISIDCDYIDVPKLENWQKRDFIKSYCEGLSDKQIDYLLSICTDIYRLDNEISKLNIFNKNIRESLFDLFVDDGMYTDITDKNIFDFSNGIQNKDTELLLKVYKQFYQADIEPLGLVTILYNNFKKMIQVWCQANPTPENTGLKSNQIWAIKNMKKQYSYNQLIDAFNLLSQLELKLKQGLIDNDLIVDYIVANLL